MNACVESVCPNTMIPESLETPVEAQVKPIGVHGEMRRWINRAWEAVAGPRELKAPPIAHVHVESFYAAVEQAQNPRLRGKAVLVLGGGVVASTSPEGQGRGVSAGMSVREALKACPTAIIVPGDYARYAEIAEQVRRILEKYDAAVEMKACGSFYLEFNCTALPFSQFGARLRQMQAEVLGETGLSASVGAGRSRIVAALAAREHRPCGLHVVALGAERDFLASFAIEKMQGIAAAHLSLLKQGGLKTVGELQRIPKAVLVTAFGAAIGQRMWNLVRGREAGDFEGLTRSGKGVHSEAPAPA